MLVFASDLSSSPDMPKSQSFTSPFLLTRTFVGLTSTEDERKNGENGRHAPRWDDAEVVP